MGWREIVGADKEPVSNFKTHTQNSHNTQKPPGHPPFADITDITEEKMDSDEPVPTPQYKIEGMTRCLHGEECIHMISNPPSRVVCALTGIPVFDLGACPNGWWKCSTIGAVRTYYSTRPIK